MNAIELKNVTFAYEKNIPVISRVSLEIKRGKYTAILGHNGSGKSTLAKLITGLLLKDEGEIIVDDIKLDEKSVYKIREKVGIIFQNPDNQFIGATVKDDIAFGLENRCVEQVKMEGIILEYAKKVGMDEYLEKEPTYLSGGQKQRVAIAGVLAMAPDIIIFDEATSMLDPRGKKEINDLIAKMNEIVKDITIISITHDMEEALQADEIIIMNEGTIFAKGTPEEIFKEAEILRKVNLDVPLIYQIKNELKTHNIELKSTSWEGLVNELCQLNLDK